MTKKQQQQHNDNNDHCNRKDNWDYVIWYYVYKKRIKLNHVVCRYCNWACLYVICGLVTLPLKQSLQYLQYVLLPAAEELAKMFKHVTKQGFGEDVGKLLGTYDLLHPNVV